MIERCTISSRWHKLTQNQRDDHFRRDLAPYTFAPSTLVTDELERLQIATLELLEDRETSTVYRIRETGKVFMVTKELTYTFHDYEKYLSTDDEPDNPARFVAATKPPVFTIGESNTITRHKKPAFKAKYDPQTKEIFDVEWTDGEPGQVTAISNLKKAKYFLENYVKGE